MTRSRSWLGLSLLAGMPIVVLAGYALLGLRAERRATLADAYAEGLRLVRSVGANVDVDIDEAFEVLDPVVVFDTTPTPSKSHEDERRLREGGMETWQELCQSTFRTTSGVPIRALAAWKVYRADPSETNRDRLARLAIYEAPSVLSPRLLEHAGVPKWEERWQAEEKRREALASAAVVLSNGPLGEIGALSGWAEDGKVLTKGELVPLIEEALPITVPEWMQVRARRGPEILVPESGVTEGLLLASHRGKRFEMQAVLVNEGLLLAPYHRRQGWTLGMIGLATLTSLMGLVLTQRALRRERRLSEMKSQFVASVSHELRAPVASMRLMAEALESGKVSERGKAKSFHRLMASESARLASMVENVLDFARIEQDRKSYVMAETDVEGLAEDAVALLRPQAEAKEITLRTTFEKLSFLPEIDGLAIQQALVNLIDNAIKFSPKDSSVTVTLRASEDGWLLSVSDEGPGIAARDHSRVFERFTRLENELRRETQGAGIGLSLVQHVADGHGGRVSLESFPGKGSTFTLHFPHG